MKVGARVNGPGETPADTPHRTTAQSLGPCPRWHHAHDVTEASTRFLLHQHSTMSTIKNHETVREYHARLSTVTPIDIMLWKTLKGLLQALLLIATAHLGVLHGADPTVLYPIGLIGGLVMMIGEVKEVELAGIATIILGKPGNKK